MAVAGIDEGGGGEGFIGANRRIVGSTAATSITASQNVPAADFVKISEQEIFIRSLKKKLSFSLTQKF